jgi:hypothetical protein
LAGAILLSRPGHWALLLGQPAILLSVLAYLAFLYGKTRPALAGVALSWTLFKPTYGVPLALLLYAWNRRQAAAIAIGLALLLNLPLIALLAVREGGLSQLLESAASGYRGWQNITDVNPVTSNTRTDLTSLISRFLEAPLSDVNQVLLAAAILLLAGCVLRLLARQASDDSNAAAVGIICLATSLVGFHRGYDLVLLVGPVVAAAVPHPVPAMPSQLRLLLLVLFSILALNWIATESVLSRWQLSRSLWLIVTSLNGVCLVLLFLSFILIGTRAAFGSLWSDTQSMRPGLES